MIVVATDAEHFVVFVEGQETSASFRSKQLVLSNRKKWRRHRQQDKEISSFTHTKAHMLKIYYFGAVNWIVALASCASCPFFWRISSVLFFFQWPSITPFVVRWKKAKQFSIETMYGVENEMASAIISPLIYSFRPSLSFQFDRWNGKQIIKHHV